jgi:hypothetical protein
LRQCLEFEISNLLQHQASFGQTVPCRSDAVGGGVDQSLSFIGHEDKLVVGGLGGSEGIPCSENELGQSLIHRILGALEERTALRVVLTDGLDHSEQTPAGPDSLLGCDD